MKIACVMGTRPEILKFYSVLKELKNENIEHEVFFTGQHFSYEMGQSFFEEFGITVNRKLEDEYSGGVAMEWLLNEFKEYKPDVVLVQGDTNSALFGALAGAMHGAKVGHIEAGLRTWDFDSPFPEEHNRLLIDNISYYKFCPTGKNLLNVEYGKRYLDKSFITGNTIIDLLHEKFGKEPITEKKNQVVITCHRRENWNKIEEICEAIKELASKFPDTAFLFVKNANKELANKIDESLKDSRVVLLEPMKYMEFINLIRESSYIISDSGGIVEEASYLQTEVGIIRDNTERTEAIIAGWANMIGTNKKDIVNKVSRFMGGAPIERLGCPFGNGKAGKMIVNILKGENK